MGRGVDHGHYCFQNRLTSTPTLPPPHLLINTSLGGGEREGEGGEREKGEEVEGGEVVRKNDRRESLFTYLHSPLKRNYKQTLQYKNKGIYFIGEQSKPTELRAFLYMGAVRHTIIPYVTLNWMGIFCKSSHSLDKFVLQ